MAEFCHKDHVVAGFLPLLVRPLKHSVMAVCNARNTLRVWGYFPRNSSIEVRVIPFGSSACTAMHKHELHEHELHEHELHEHGRHEHGRHGLMDGICFVQDLLHFAIMAT